MIIYAEGDNPAADALAKSVLESLWTTYPGHPWAVYVRGGVMFIKYLDPRMSGNWGIAKRLGMLDFDAKVLETSIKMMAGEWLERARLRRGASTGEAIKHVDGVPDKHQPYRVAT